MIQGPSPDERGLSSSRSPRIGRAMGRLRGIRALVTGGTSGIGAAIVDRFRADGASVVFTGRDETRAQEVAARTGASFVRADVRDADDVRASVQKAVELARRPRRPRRQRGRSPRRAALRDERRGLGRGPRDEPARPLPLRGRLPARAPRRRRRIDHDDLVGRRRLGRDDDRRLLRLEARAEHARPGARGRGGPERRSA